jgi:hypothetical protein
VAEINTDLHKLVELPDSVILVGFKMVAAVGIIMCRKKWKRFAGRISEEKGRK